MTLSREKQALFWFIGFAVFAVVLHSLSSILLPFVAGMAIAYFLDPVADRLEEWGASRALATTAIVAAFFVAVIGLLLVLFPMLQAQVIALAALVPGLIDTLRDYAEPLLERLRADLPPEAVERLKEAAGAYAGTVIQWIAGLAAGIWRGGIAFFNLLSLVVITPIVAFYLLRDWDLIVERLDSHLPRRGADTIRFLNDLISQEIGTMESGQVARSLLLGPQGKLDHILWVMRGDDGIRLVTDRGRGGDLAATLGRYRIRVDVEIGHTDQPAWIVVGETAVEPGTWSMTDGGLEAMMSDKLTLGADISVAVGSLGAGVEAATTLNAEADIYSFSRAKGLFGGVSFEGAVLVPDDDANEAYYGRAIAARGIVIHREVENADADGLRAALVTE